MWWWLGLGGLATAKLLIDVFNDPPATPQKKLSILETNLSRLRLELHSENSRRIAILGQPGAGKSSLLKRMTQGKVRPLPVIGVETDATNWSDSTDCHLLSRYDEYTFIDVPGYDTIQHPLHTMRMHFPFSDMDVYILVIRDKLRNADQEIFRAISRSGKPVCVVRSFAETLDSNERNQVKRDLQNRFELDKGINIEFFSSRTKEGISRIFGFVKKHVG